MRTVRSRKSRWIGGALAALGVMPLISGCEVGNVFAREEIPATDFQDPSAEDGVLESQGLAAYLDMMRRLIESDAGEQSEIFLEVAQAAAGSPTTTNRLKLALAVATPGHPNENAEEARQLLTDLLAAGPALLSEERMLVAIHLEEVEQRLNLETEARRLREEAAAAHEAQNDENARRLEAALAENERLSKELREAQQKLDAITNIERSIRERENGANP